jgi:hypothetical protein
LVTSQIYDSIPKQQETFDRNDITRIIADFDRRYPGDDLFWMLVPTILMLTGGFLLDRVAERKDGKRQPPISN